MIGLKKLLRKRISGVHLNCATDDLLNCPISYILSFFPWNEREKRYLISPWMNGDAVYDRLSTRIKRANGIKMIQKKWKKKKNPQTASERAYGYICCQTPRCRFVGCHRHRVSQISLALHIHTHARARSHTNSLSIITLHSVCAAAVEWNIRNGRV